MVEYVRKRNGSIVDFDSNKIQTAVDKAFQEVRQTDCLDDNVLQTVLRRIRFHCNDSNTISVVESASIATTLIRFQ